ncbi:putative membrane-bound metal-dependent hydrolase (DUF457) [Desulfosporosinus acidiphilus SJ4]|uniref:Putative membrane-bound metal-dependent hydrolase (DUF457) n=1 Tax=Desulfosporosinus acidiphilus (strain DSM 22704 / JCM 16185 / SJ4) TaxID=646529 RepID=I4DAW5_DESAJ|nr:metal-dependent hydrolase [Desulfosporosinus acidiphilus]AFM42939.1 putative membrane-bound metal-dependent hydrolase (DUF457) [Desulfosporosinus acidiphilus SJ4]
MEAKTHIVFAEALAILSPIYLRHVTFPSWIGPVSVPNNITLSLLVGAGIGALIPDALDCPKALLAKRIPGMQLAMHTESVLEYAPIVGKPLEKLHLHHRGPAHSWIAIVGAWFLAPAIGTLFVRIFTALVVLIRFPALAFWVSALMGIGWQVGFVIGCFSHDLIDTLNTVPVFFFWPLRIPVKVFPGKLGVPVGSPLEDLVRWVILLGLFWLNPVAGIITFFFSEWFFKKIAQMPESPI